MSGREICSFCAVCGDHTGQSNMETDALLYVGHHLVQFQCSDHSGATSEGVHRQLDAAGPQKNNAVHSGES